MKEHKFRKEVGHWPYLAIVAVVAVVAVVFLVMQNGVYVTSNTSETEVAEIIAPDGGKKVVIEDENGALAGQAGKIGIIYEYCKDVVTVNGALIDAADPFLAQPSYYKRNVDSKVTSIRDHCENDTVLVEVWCGGGPHIRDMYPTQKEIDCSLMGLKCVHNTQTGGSGDVCT